MNQAHENSHPSSRAETKNTGVKKSTNPDNLNFSQTFFISSSQQRTNKTSEKNALFLMSKCWVVRTSFSSSVAFKLDACVSNCSTRACANTSCSSKSDAFCDTSASRILFLAKQRTWSAICEMERRGHTLNHSIAPPNLMLFVILPPLEFLVLADKKRTCGLVKWKKNTAYSNSLNCRFKSDTSAESRLRCCALAFLRSLNKDHAVWVKKNRVQEWNKYQPG